MDFGYIGVQIAMMDEITKLRNLVDESVRENICEGILLSGGLDTSIIAVVASHHNPNLKAFTVTFEQAPDLDYSIKLAKRLNLEHHIITLEEKDMLANIKPTIEILRSFDPMEIRNSVAIYSGLKFAKEYVGSIMTGDGGDELFAGYSYLQKMSNEELVEYSKRLFETLHFSSIKLGERLGIHVRIPFLARKIKSFALTLSPDLKIREGVGKWILRKAFEKDLPAEFTWREKVPVEYGSGTTLLTKIIETRITNHKFQQKRERYGKEGVEIRDKEHLYYYEIFMNVFEGIPSPKEGELMCCGCGGGLPPNSSYCRICGTMNDKNGKN